MTPGPLPSRGQRGERGFALLLVLWSLVLLSLILTHVLAAGRSETQLATNLRNAAVAEAVADGAVQDAAFHLLARGSQAWPARGTHLIRIGRGVAQVSIEDLANRINPNNADALLLAAAFAQCGAPASDAARLAQAVIAWRSAPDASANAAPDGSADALAAQYRAAGLAYAPPREPMQSLDELGLVAGMTPGLVACLTPHLSLYQDGNPGPRSDDAVVARAVAAAVQNGDIASGTPVSGPLAVEITAVATVAGGRFVRRATLRLAASEDGRPFRILEWQAP